MILKTKFLFKNKQKIQETLPPQDKRVITESHLKDHQANLQTQLVEAQTKVVMLQGAIQMVGLQIQEMNPTEKNPVNNNKDNKNGVK